MPFFYSLYEAEKGYQGIRHENISLKMNSVLQAATFLFSVATLLSNPITATAAFSTVASACFAVTTYLLSHQFGHPERIPKDGLGKSVGSPQFLSAAGLVCLGLSGLFRAHVALFSLTSLPAAIATLMAFTATALSSSHKIDRHIPQWITVAAASMFAIGSLLNFSWTPAAATICSTIGRSVTGHFYYRCRSPSLAQGS